MSVISPGMIDADSLSRFEMKVDRSGPDKCWEWNAYRSKDGYGRFFLAGKKRQAHRVSFVISSGRVIAPESLVLHSCDNPPCCNPAHLNLGGFKENMKDMLSRDRGSYKLSARDVVEARRLHNAGFSIKHIAKKFGVSYQALTQCNRGKTWGHIPGGKPSLIRRGSHHGRAKLTEKEVVEIRERRKNGDCCKVIAEDFGISAGYIYTLAANAPKVWNHV